LVLGVVVRRLALAPLLVFGVVTTVFFVARLLPGDPVEHLATADSDPEFVPRLRRQMALDRPPVVQYAHWLGRVVRGDLGDSWSTRRPVTALLGEALPNTLRLAAIAFALRWTLAIVLGVTTAVHHGRRTDTSLRVATLVVDALPGFVLGVGLQLVFAYWLQWLPPSGMASLDALGEPFWSRTVDALAHLVLPVVVLGVSRVATSARYVRASILESATEPHVLAARARGIPEDAVLRRHVLRNALAPLVTLFGLSLPGLVAGSLVVEFLFSWPGMGRLTLAAARAHDQPVLLATTMLAASMVVLANLAADVAASAADPRIRAEVRS
jgi:peptide/nickel transport system permease protein